MGKSDSSSNDDLTRLNRSKKKSKKKRSKAHKKEKKHRKKKYRSSSSDNSSTEDEWVVKESLEQSTKKESTPTEDDWGGLFGSSSVSTRKSEKEQRMAERRAERINIDEAGRHALELNPYWKNGGTGLPDEDRPTSSSCKVVGDGGLSWLRKSYLRAKEQAEEEGKSLEEVAEERWGSLEAFYKLLEEAEEKAGRTENAHNRKADEGRERYHGKSKGKSFQRPTYDSEHNEAKHSTIIEHKHAYGSSYGRSGWKKVHSPEQNEITHAVQKQSSEKTEYATEPITEDNEPVRFEGEINSAKVLTEKELNELSARILKAEIMGNLELAMELQGKKEAAEKLRDESSAHLGKTVKTVTKIVLDEDQGPSRRRKNKPGDTHKDGKRQRYFADDDKHSLKSMFEREKRTTAADGNAVFSGLIGKGIKTNNDYDLDDAFVDRAGSSKNVIKEREREVREVLAEEKKYGKTLESCAWCFDGRKLAKNLVIAAGEKSYLCLPPYQSITDGHCLIVPMSHVESATCLDEDVWEEMQKFRKSICDMFRERDMDVVLFESARNLKSHPHMYIECVPMPQEVGDLAPIYFKKAIQECESEWSQNKKLIDLRKKDVRKGVPKGLPYFCVDFGMDSGFAHVIEDEQEFPLNFAQEILGGMMELDHSLWRKRKLEGFEAQRAKVMEFLKSWGPYDWTNP